MTWVALGIIVLVVLITFWPSRKGTWDEYGDGYLYVYTAVSSGRTLGEVYADRGGWEARIVGRATARFATVEAAMRHVEVEAKP